MGFKTDVIIWDFYSGCKLGQYNHHLTRVNAVSFSYDGRYLMSVGNMDDGNVCIFDMEAKKVICGMQDIRGRNGFPFTIAATNSRNDVWVVGGDDYLSYWILDTYQNRLKTEKANLKKIKRDIKVIRIDDADEFAYCGTATGDVIKVKLNLPRRGGGCDPVGPPSPGPVISCTIGRKPCKAEKGRNVHLYKGGVTAMQILKSGDFIIGGGNGVVSQSRMKTICKGGAPEEIFEEYGPQMSVRGQVTSIALNCEDVLVGSTMNEIYYARLGFLDGTKMLVSAHYSVVNDISFPKCFSEVFASCNYEDVRIWNSVAMRELVRINVANMTCQAVIFSTDGRSVISGWNDSHIRTYTPQSGSPLWVIHHAHLRGVSALAITSDNRRLISGGDEGQVRVWSLCPQQMTPIGIMKEHLGPVTGLRMRGDDTEVASSSGDGSIIIWDLEKFVRRALVLQDTLFLDVAWHPSECQILGVTHNHKLGYFEAFDGSSVREIMASETDPIHSVDVSSCGLYIVTGGADRQVKLWSYKEAKLLRKGVVHSAEVTRVRFSPCSDYILSCCQDGSIFKWEFPKDLACVSVSICPQKCHAKLEQPAVTDGGGYPGLPRCS